MLTIRNTHAASCGAPPEIVYPDAAGERGYVGYFENAHGEQWILREENGTLILRGGDIGWGKSVKVSQKGAEGLVLNEAEAMWLRACWLAWTR